MDVGTRPNQSGYGSTKTFFRQIRDLVIDVTRIPPTEAATGIDWPTVQTISLENVIFIYQQLMAHRIMVCTLKEGLEGS